MRKLASSAASRISGALRPRTAAAYERTFKMFLAFVIFCKLQDCTTETTIVLYLEFLIQNGLSAVSLHNALSVLQHYFALYSWNVANLSSRKVVLMCKSAKNNLPLKPKVKGIFTVDMLERLVHLTSDLPNAETFKALFLFAFYGFFRLASLAPLHCQPLKRHVIPWLRISSGLLRVCNTSKKQPKICSLHLSIDWFSCHVCRMRSYVQ